MGRAPCCSKVGLHRGPWTPREDNLLRNYIHTHGEGHWRSLPKNAGLLRCGKSCRLRWMNYLRPDIKRGNISPDEDDLIIRLHSLLGNRWSLIAGRLPGRTDNEIKNYWNTHLSKRLLTQVTDPNTCKELSEPIRTRQTKNRNNKKKEKKEEEEEEEVVKELIVDENIQEKTIKVHQPKPSRVSSFSLPRNNSFGYCNTCSSNGTTSTYQEKEECNNNNNIVSNWSNFKDGDDDQFIHQDLVNGSDSFECQSDENSNSLEKLFEEYFELLKTEETQVELDTFAESLLMI